MIASSYLKETRTRWGTNCSRLPTGGFLGSFCFAQVAFNFPPAADAKAFLLDKYGAQALTHVIFGRLASETKERMDDEAADDRNSFSLLFLFFDLFSRQMKQAQK